MGKIILSIEYLEFIYSEALKENLEFFLKKFGLATKISHILTLNLGKIYILAKKE